MINALNTAVSGLHTATIRTDVSAHDVANINTKGFAERSIVQSENQNSSGSHVSQIRKTPNNNPLGTSNTDLATETVERITGSYDFKAQLSTIKTADTMLGELLDLKA
jgi:flagellar hook protein FlgE